MRSLLDLRVAFLLSCSSLLPLVSAATSAELDATGIFVIVLVIIVLVAASFIFGILLFCRSKGTRRDLERGEASDPEFSGSVIASDSAVSYDTIGFVKPSKMMEMSFNTTMDKRSLMAYGADKKPKVDAKCPTRMHAESNYNSPFVGPPPTYEDTISHKKVLPPTFVEELPIKKPLPVEVTSKEKMDAKPESSISAPSLPPLSRKSMASSEDLSDMESLPVNTMKSEDMIRPSTLKPISRVLCPFASAETVTEVGKNNSSDTIEPEPKMVQIGYPTKPKYEVPASSESVLSARAVDSESVLHSHEHLVDTKGKAMPMTAAAQQPVKPEEASAGGSETPKPVAEVPAPAPPSAASSAPGVKRVPSDNDLPTAIEDKSISEGKKSKPDQK
ncbi:hypothetical protein L596_009141 [Steinernema carpocapsae]|uniref:Uncharacterized protein n=1 Tax=Steinernema carpocapsae TaxID=34508 RepID=A0A4U5PES2_STECR|nr:hypothetical protein L596_009141 [Steinernema carpocapsae]